MTFDYRTIVITGVTGAIGARILESVERLPCERIVAVFSREASLARFTAKRRLPDNVLPVIADLRTDESVATLSEALRGLGPAAFIHAAADVSWTKSLVALEALNIGGAMRVAKVAAEHHPGLGALVIFSTAYAHRDNGVLLNAYEESKRTVERAVVETYGDRLKIGIVRPSLVVGESQTGRISRYNGLYPLVRVIAFGELPCIIGDRDYAVDLVPVDWVGDEALALIDRLGDGPSPQVVTLAADEQAVSLGDLVQLIHARAGARMAEWGQAAPQVVSIIKQRQFDFLMKAAPSWDMEERFVQVNRISEIMAGYLGHSGVEGRLRRHNAWRPPPRLADYLPVAIDYWLQEHRDRLMRPRTPSWAQ